MNYRQFHAYQQRFVTALRAVLSERGNDRQICEAAFPAYSDPSALIRFLFWRRIRVTINFLESQGPCEAVLDFGCGSGVVLPFLTGFANRVVGLDIDIAPYRALSDHISFPDKIEVYETKEYPLSRFPDRTFDVIIALDVLEHVRNLRDVFTEFCRVAKPGGMIIVCGPTENLFYRFGRMIAGKQYTGNYHVTNIHSIRKVMDTLMETETLATLYYPFPLFKVIRGTPL
jgi:2-polyprenyl-6-hydroxyphenyl methylase/3-demethylubiquinone-9 3-methyltransferase